ncbi:glycosyltransferase [Myxococcaceae bacterium JPH2]|nr:glycosyltransferase [Myxococcaceae bacterium JPH2]
MKPRRVCFVTSEIYPATAGGIGRIIHNLIEESLRRTDAVEFHLLLCTESGADPLVVSNHFGGKVTVHATPPREPWSQAFDEQGVYAPRESFTDSYWHGESMGILLHLRKLASQGLHFDVIEFPDYTGVAFCTLQDKLLGCGFQDTEIAVRLHSTSGVLVPHEPNLLNRDYLGEFELERKALLDADRVISHLPGVAEHNRQFYGFPESWLTKVVQEFPPVAPRMASRPELYTGERDVLFATKIQTLKRPDLFVRGVSAFLRSCPEYRGHAVFSCHAPSEDTLSAIKALIPPDLRRRFRFVPPGPDRDELLRKSIVVIPSDYESLNLTAYEASVAGATLVLNGACPAFAPGTPWADGKNCYTFDGSVESLAAALQRAWQTPVTTPVEWSVDVPYWEGALRHAPPEPAPRSTRPLVSVLITNHNLARYLPETLASVAASSYPEIEIIIVDDASTEAFDHEVLQRISEDIAKGDSGVRLVRNTVNRGLPASRNIGIRAAKGAYILPLDADDCISPTFIEMAVNALERHAEFDVVVPSTGYFPDDAALEARRFSDYALFIGDCPTMGMVANRLSCATSLMRRSLFDRFKYNDRLTSYEDWDLYLRLSHAGHRFLVTNAIHFHYRKRPGSMISGVNPRRHVELLRQMHMSLPRPMTAAAHAWAFFSVAEPARPHAAAPVMTSTDLPALRYEFADALNGALKRVPLVHTLLKQAASGLGDGADKPRRHELMDMLNSTLKRLPGVHSTLKRVVKPGGRGA